MCMQIFNQFSAPQRLALYYVYTSNISMNDYIVARVVFRCRERCASEPENTPPVPFVKHIQSLELCKLLFIVLAPTI